MFLRHLSRDGLQLNIDLNDSHHDKAQKGPIWRQRALAAPSSHRLGWQQAKENQLKVLTTSGCIKTVRADDGSDSTNRLRTGRQKTEGHGPTTPVPHVRLKMTVQSLHISHLPVKS